MVDRMMGVMMDRMMTRMSKEEIQGMMAEMMGSMFTGVDLVDKIAFMQAMMGVCIPRITEGLGPVERDRLAQKILSRMAAEIAGPAPTKSS